MKKNIKGLVMSVEDGCAIVLTPEGEFIKTKMTLEPYFVGEEITFTVDEPSTINERRAIWKNFRIPSLKFTRPVLQWALSLCLVFIGGVGSWAYPVGHVYMDVNPSLGMSYNIYHRVIGMESFNEDGAKVLDKVAYYGKTISEGLESTLKAMDAEGYIKEETQGVSGVLIGYTDSNLEGEFVKSVVETSEKMKKTLQVASVKVDETAEEIANEDKGQIDAISPIQATLAEKEINSKNPEISKDKELKAQLKTEIKTKAKALKNKGTVQLIEENQGNVKIVTNPKVEEIKKKINDAEILKKKRKLQEEQDRKDRERIEKDRRDKPAEKDKDEGKEKGKEKDKSKVKDEFEDKEKYKDEDKDKDKDKDKDNGKEADRGAQLQKIINEISRLNALIEQIQNGDGKEKQKAAKIKQILKQIERLREAQERLQED